MTPAPAPSLRHAKRRADAGTPLYVHLPFCAAKCHYCDFFSVADEGQEHGPMLAAILREAELYAPRAPRTLFLGGGTPSLLSVPELELLLEGLERISGWRASASEVTIECNPESLDVSKARALLALGVNRFSIGFQSLDDEVLRLFGRVHSAEQSFAAYAAAREAGAANVNVDLIYAIPGQSLERWEQDLARILELGPEHLSAYNLTFEEETLFRRWLEEGRLAKQPEELELAFFERTRELTAAAGLQAYEISNFARPARQCEHNVNYWRNGPYLGLGPSAVSKQGWTRLGNVKGIQGYVRRMAESDGALAWSEEPAPLERLAETWWLGLRLAEGITAEEARLRSGLDLGEDEPCAALAERLAGEGLLTLRAGRWRLSERGLPLGDAVARAFLAEATRPLPAGTRSADAGGRAG